MAYMAYICIYICMDMDMDMDTCTCHLSLTAADREEFMGCDECNQVYCDDCAEDEEFLPMR